MKYYYLFLILSIIGYIFAIFTDNMNIFYFWSIVSAFVGICDFFTDLLKILKKNNEYLENVNRNMAEILNILNKLKSK